MISEDKVLFVFTELSRQNKLSQEMQKLWKRYGDLDADHQKIVVDDFYDPSKGSLSNTWLDERSEIVRKLLDHINSVLP